MSNSHQASGGQGTWGKSSRVAPALRATVLIAFHRFVGGDKSRRGNFSNPVCALLSNAVGVSTVGIEWTTVGIGDMDGNGSADIQWRGNNGAVSFWFMNGAQFASAVSIGIVGTEWRSCQRDAGST